MNRVIGTGQRSHEVPSEVNQAVFMGDGEHDGTLVIRTDSGFTFAFYTTKTVGTAPHCVLVTLDESEQLEEIGRTWQHTYACDTQGGLALIGCDDTEPELPDGCEIMWASWEDQRDTQLDLSPVPPPPRETRYRCVNDRYGANDEYTVDEFLEMCESWFGSRPDLREMDGDLFDADDGALTLRQVELPLSVEQAIEEDIERMKHLSSSIQCTMFVNARRDLRDESLHGIRSVAGRCKDARATRDAIERWDHRWRVMYRRVGATEWDWLIANGLGISMTREDAEWLAKDWIASNSPQGEYETQVFESEDQ